MDIKYIMQERHTVRKYKDELISANIKDKINAKIIELCHAHDISVDLETDGKTALRGIMTKFMSSNVKNVIAFKGDRYQVGYVAAELMLFIQELGLNSWFVGGSINRKKLGEDVVALLAFGYGQTNGKGHQTKTISQVSDYQPNRFPEWYLVGLNASLLAPTAFNKQHFYVDYNNGNPQIHVKTGPYAELEAGILSCFFEKSSGHKLTYGEA
ncbi:nitroreductase family protein [Limosilactobacillus gastricus]|uniref:nitroreductase family protein n=1 Tax=Limosilactobacillus gastricus TaxID=227942 RepID=UPI000315ED6B|nr:nitroreductase family protein [Limosilactobacillus gastricus]